MNQDDGKRRVDKQLFRRRLSECANVQRTRSAILISPLFFDASNAFIRGVAYREAWPGQAAHARG